MKKMFSLLLIVVISFSSCRQCEIVACDQFETITLNFVHYQVSEVDHIVIRKFQQQSNFTQLHDTIQAALSAVRGDTAVFEFIDRRAENMYELNTEYDLEIYNPSDQKAIRLSDIEREHNTIEHCHGPFARTMEWVTCENKLLGFNYSVNKGSIDARGNIIDIVK